MKRRTLHRGRKSPPVPEVKKLIEMRERAGLTRYGLSRLAQTDERYLARLEDGIALNPSRDLLLHVAMTLVRYTSLFNRGDVDAVLKAADFPPSPERLWAAGCCSGSDGNGHPYR